jgi:hypothetical protein
MSLYAWSATIGRSRAVVAATDCEHAAELAAARWRREHGTFPREVQVVGGPHRLAWRCRVSLSGEAVAFEGPGTRSCTGEIVQDSAK